MSKNPSKIKFGEFHGGECGATGLPKAGIDPKSKRNKAIPTAVKRRITLKNHH